MIMIKMNKFAAIIILVILSGCSSTASVQLTNEFPQVLAKPKPLSAAVVFEPSFATYVAKPNSKTMIDIGAAQVRLLRNAFAGLFSKLEFVASREEITAENAMVIIPSVREVQVSTPSDNYLNVFEVWIKYNLDLETVDGEAIDSWFMPAYGKTPDAFMASKGEAIEEASIIALRDAGAKLMLDFYRIPAVNNWVAEEQRRVRKSTAQQIQAQVDLEPEAQTNRQLVDAQQANSTEASK
ncbi:hypothetical protein OAE19_06785 [Porticoccaceae bacterium]|nr:hypothetical protein [Porticoccaceae bacterium]MDC0004089.1 hypothetical protein [Porticoccaceae bacterium]